MQQSLDTVLVWFRRDCRTADNPALVAALNSARTVIPVFVWAPEEEGQFQPGRQSRWWCKHTVLCLSQRLQQLGSRLVVRRGRESVEALRELVAETGAQAVFFNHLYDSISMVRDQQVKDALRASGVLVSTFNADLLYEPWEVLDDAQQPYTTFKAYWDRCLAMPYAPPLPLPEPSGPLPAVPDDVASLAIREVDWFMSPEQESSTEALTHRWDPSGQAAVARLEGFLQQGLPAFQHDRAKTDRESTTMLSPWIHFGSISVRHIYYRVAQKHAEWAASGANKGKSCLDFLQQMGYREYSRYLAFHFPFITERSMLAHLRAVPWRLDQDAFKAWRQGLTGYPWSTQLWSMGWCHNRVRVVASHFLVKHLLLPWQWGLKHLWDCQIDADLECDALGWQYVSGCLSDAHPFSYLVDLEQEWKRFDPDGHYVRRWLPVLSQLPAEFIHQPWKAPPDVLEEAGVELGFNYPWPIITPEAAREGVDWASSVVAQCAAAAAGGGGSSGTGGGGGSSSGGSGSTAFNTSLMPRKEPYRPPTDPALLSSFLAAAKGSSSWQERLPPLYIHSATGHPLSLAHTAQARPMWGPALQHTRATASGSSESASGSGSGRAGWYLDHSGRRYRLRPGHMGQQQLLAIEQSMSDSADDGGALSASSSEPSPAGSGADGAAAEDDAMSSGGEHEGGDDSQQQRQHKRQHRSRMPAAAGAGVSCDEEHVVPSVVAGGGGAMLQRPHPLAAAAGDDDDEDMAPAAADYGRYDAWGGGMYARPAAGSIATACSKFGGSGGGAGRAAAAAAAGTGGWAGHQQQQSTEEACGDNEVDMQGDDDDGGAEQQQQHQEGLLLAREATARLHIAQQAQ